MDIFTELGEQYREIDNFLASKELGAREHGLSEDEFYWQKRRVQNDHAYFLFLFSRMENKIREESSKLIIDKQNALHDWNERRAWDILPKDKESTDIHFKKRAALLIQKSHSEYKLLMQYYDLRNTITHGGEFSTFESIPNIIADFTKLYKIVKV